MSERNTMKITGIRKDGRMIYVNEFDDSVILTRGGDNKVKCLHLMIGEIENGSGTWAYISRTSRFKSSEYINVSVRKPSAKQVDILNESIRRREIEKTYDDAKYELRKNKYFKLHPTKTEDDLKYNSMVLSQIRFSADELKSLPPYYTGPVVDTTVATTFNGITLGSSIKDTYNIITINVEVKRITPKSIKVGTEYIAFSMIKQIELDSTGNILLPLKNFISPNVSGLK